MLPPLHVDFHWLQHSDFPSDSSRKSFEGSRMKDSSDEEEVSLGCSTLTLSPLVPESPPLRRSQPILISTNRYDRQSQTRSLTDSKAAHTTE